jgi:16S rRNA processing protein RimM
VRPDALVPIAALVGAHGLRGELRVKLYNPSSALLLTHERFVLRGADGSERPVRVTAVHEHGHGQWHVAIADCRDRDQALGLRGGELCVLRSELPALGEGEHYLLDLEGLDARAVDGTVVGRVDKVIEYPASHVLRLLTQRGALEVPFAEPYVLDVRAAEGYVIVSEIDDLEPTPPPRARKQ